MKYFFIAGEASGDIHAAPVMAAIKEYDPDASFTFLGGDNMLRVADTTPVVHIRDMAYMGFSEVLKHLGDIRRNMKATRQAIAQTRPDCLILIDYPSFNLKIARYAHKLGIPVFYYISPKIWAWKEWRARAIKRLVTHMYVIFPFEVEYYRRRHGYDVTYVGNPSLSEIDKALTAIPARSDFANANRLNERREWVALLPGSRIGEIRNNLPIMLSALATFPQYRPIIAAAPAIDPAIYDTLAPGTPRVNDTTTLLAHSRVALVTSGTATLEAALVGTPQVAVYRANGSRLSYNIMKRLLHVNHVTLPNLIADREIIPEMLLHLCTPDNIASHLARLLPDGSERQTMLDDYAAIRQILGTQDAPRTIAADITRRLSALQ